MSVSDGTENSEAKKLTQEQEAKDTVVVEQLAKDKAAEDEQKLRQKTFEDLCNEARKRQLFSSENFDKGPVRNFVFKA